MKKKVPLVLSDVDGTIYPSNQNNFNFLESQKEAIDFLHKNNGIFAICTGNYHRDRLRKLAKDLNADYLITSNGALIEDVKNQKIIFKKAFDLINQVKFLLSVAKDYDLHLNFWTDDEFYTFNFQNWNKNCYVYPFLPPYENKFHKVETVDDLSEEVLKKIIKAELFFASNQLFLMKKIADQLQKKDFVISIMDFHIEVTKKHVSKGSALVFLANFLNQDYKKTMTIGDSSNDWSMLEISDFSYAMANASFLTKSKAKFYTSSVEQDGLSEAIYDYLYRLFNLKKDKVI